MCDDCDLNDHGKYSCNTNVYSRSADLFRRDISTVANYFYQWYYWNLVTCTQ